MVLDKSIRYMTVKDEEENSDDGAFQSYKPAPTSSRPSFKIIGLVALWVLSLITACELTYWFNLPRAGYLRKESQYSPIHERFKIPLITQQVDKTLFPNASNPDHIYRLRPSPEVDAAWDRIADVGYFPISMSEIKKVGKDPDYMVLAPDSWGLGRDSDGNSYSFMNIDVFHELHCLNMLRKGLVHNYDYYTGHEYGFVPGAKFEFHLDHCLDIIRQALMCHGDAEIATHVWRQRQSVPFPDLAIDRTCIDFEALLAWQNEHRIPDMSAKWNAMVKPEGVMAYPGPYGLPKAGVDGVFKEDGDLRKALVGLEGVEYCLGDNTEHDVI